MVTKYQLVRDLLQRYDQIERPLSLSEITSLYDEEPTELRPKLDSLLECELLTLEGGCYRPTVTARQLLALDVGDESLIVIEVDDDNYSENGAQR